MSKRNAPASSAMLETSEGGDSLDPPSSKKSRAGLYGFVYLLNINFHSFLPTIKSVFNSRIVNLTQLTSHFWIWVRCKNYYRNLTQILEKRISQKEGNVWLHREYFNGGQKCHQSLISSTFDILTLAIWRRKMMFQNFFWMKLQFEVTYTYLTLSSLN